MANSTLRRFFLTYMSVIAFLFVTSVTPETTGCNQQELTDIKTAINTAKPFIDAACLLANLAKADAEALQACNIVDAVAGDATSFLATARTLSQQQVSAAVAHNTTAPCYTNVNQTPPAPLKDSGADAH